MNIFKRVFLNLFRKSDARLEKAYVKAGAEFGDVVSYIYMGQCIGFEKMLNKWAKLEKEYSARGFRTVSLDEFISYGGYGTPLKSLGKRREEGEPEILHAELYREHFLDKLNDGPSIVEHAIATGQAAVRRYIRLPSTKEMAEDIRKNQKP